MFMMNFECPITDMQNRNIYPIDFSFEQNNQIIRQDGRTS